MEPRCLALLEPGEDHLWRPAAFDDANRHIRWWDLAIGDIRTQRRLGQAHHLREALPCHIARNVCLLRRASRVVLITASAQSPSSVRLTPGHVPGHLMVDTRCYLML